jgi:hypothetical protein
MVYPIRKNSIILSLLGWSEEIGNVLKLRQVLELSNKVIRNAGIFSLVSHSDSSGQLLGFLIPSETHRN